MNWTKLVGDFILNANTIYAILITLTLSFLLSACSKIEDDFSGPAGGDVVVSERIYRKADVPAFNFTDVTKEFELDFIHHHGGSGDKWFPETPIGGVGFFDYNQDGYQDIVAVRGQPISEGGKGSGWNSIAVFKNEGGVSFRDVTKELGLKNTTFLYDVAAADFDGDGWPDLYVSGLTKNTLYKNIDGKGYVNVSKDMGVENLASHFTIPAIFFDADNDDDLDLFVGGYSNWTKERDVQVNESIDGVQKTYSHPRVFDGVSSVFLRNQYPEGFIDESFLSGISKDSSSQNKLKGKALGVYLFDYNDDSFLDFIVSNDTLKNFAYINNGDGSFSEKGDELGVAYSAMGLPTAAMGIDGAWVGANAKLHVAMGNFSGEMTSVYRYRKAGLFQDVAPISGIGVPTRGTLTFGVQFIDLDLDGFSDFVQANGHVEPDINILQNSQHHAQPVQAFWYCGECKQPFVEVPAKKLGKLANPIVGRGLAAADIDNDGDQDLLISTNNGPLKLFRNNQETGNHWLRVKLHNRGRNRFGIGAMVELKAGGHYQKRMMIRKVSYLSMNEAVLTFGIGSELEVDSLVVTWPGGDKQELYKLKADQVITVQRSKR